MTKVARPVSASVQRRFDDVGQRLRLARKHRGMTLVGLADLTSISRDTLHRLERGDASISIAALLKVLSTLGLEEDLEHLGADASPRREQDLVDFARRDWLAVAELKGAHWLERKRRFGRQEAFRVADDLRRHAAAARPDWPDAADRAADLASHVDVGASLRRVRVVLSR